MLHLLATSLQYSNTQLMVDVDMCTLIHLTLIFLISPVATPITELKQHIQREASRAFKIPFLPQRTQLGWHGTALTPAERVWSTLHNGIRDPGMSCLGCWKETPGVWRGDKKAAESSHQKGLSCKHSSHIVQFFRSPKSSVTPDHSQNSNDSNILHFETMSKSLYSFLPQDTVLLMFPKHSHTNSAVISFSILYKWFIPKFKPPSSFPGSPLHSPHIPSLFPTIHL